MKAIFTQKRLPDAWKSVPLGSVVDFIGGSQPPKETFRTEPYEGGVRLVQIRDFRTDKFPTYIPKNLARRHFEESDVMIGRYGPPVFQILRGLSGSYNVALMKAAPKPDLTKDYLFHLLQEPGLHHHVVANSERTAGQSGVNLTLLEAIEIPLPPLAEQRRIAEVLDRAEALRAKRRAALVELDSLTQSLFLDLFGDPVTNPQWPEVMVSDFVAGFESGKSIVADDEDDTSSPYRVLKVSAVTSLEFRPEQSKAMPPDYTPPPSHFVRAGDLLFSRANTAELIGATAYVASTPSNLLLPDKLWRFVWHKTPKADPHFVRFLFQQPKFRREIGQRASGTSGSMKNISQEKVLTIKVGLPPIALQQEFARRVGAVEKLKQAQRAALAEQDALFATLQHRAFRGEL